MAAAGTESNPEHAVLGSAVLDSAVLDSAVNTRSDLLPEELAVGSEDPRAQAAAILAESEERVSDPDAGI